MKRPPLWVWALPAAVALGLLLGLRMRPAPLPQPPVPVPVDSAAAAGRGAAASPPAAVPPAAAAPEPPFVADTAAWGADGGLYLPLDGSTTGDTLPAAPGEMVAGAALGADPPADPAPPAPPPPPRPAEGPAQSLGREAAYGRPLVAAVRGGGRLSF
ncbi:MAG TPA: hypothetical protein VFR81_07155, partial [Longimicrobium sp.]|nr:hypothetical protein [Longimicrobium sp.]